MPWKLESYSGSFDPFSNIPNTPGWGRAPTYKYIYYDESYPIYNNSYPNVGVRLTLFSYTLGNTIFVTPVIVLGPGSTTCAEAGGSCQDVSVCSSSGRTCMTNNYECATCCCPESPRPNSFFPFSQHGATVSNPTYAFDNSLNDTSTYAEFTTTSSITSVGILYLNFSGITIGSQIFYSWQGSGILNLWNYGTSNWDIVDYSPSSLTTESYTIGGQYIQSGLLQVRFGVMGDGSTAKSMKVSDTYVELV